MIKNWHQFNESHNNILIRNIESYDINEVLDLCAIVFDNVMEENELKSYLSSVTDWSISKKAVLNDKIIGCYLFNTEPVTDFLKNCECLKEDISKYENLRGIQGIALALLPEYRNSGIGRELRSIPINMGFDYIWGQHLKELHNITQWTKFGRRVVADGLVHDEDMYVTVMDL